MINMENQIFKLKVELETIKLDKNMYYEQSKKYQIDYEKTSFEKNILEKRYKEITNKYENLKK